MVFDPAHGDFGLLRTVVHMLRVVPSWPAHGERRRTRARRGTNHGGSSHAHQVNVIRKNADKIELGCDSVQTGVDRLLSQALNALDGVAMDVSGIGVYEPAAGSSAGVAGGSSAWLAARGRRTRGTFPLGIPLNHPQRQAISLCSRRRLPWGSTSWLKGDHRSKHQQHLGRHQRPASRPSGALAVRRVEDCVGEPLLEALVCR